MGIDASWPRIFKAEGAEYVETDKGVNTVFVDAQILLMKSTIPEQGCTWKEFVEKNFGQRLVALHRKYETVIVAFDNYEQVPVYKSIEQERRIAKVAPFAFANGDDVPSRPPSSKVWSNALLNRAYKTNIITMIVTMLARSYDPHVQKKTLILDFVNVVEITFTPYERKQSVLEDMQAMGESDVKFMRYADKYGDLVVESVDSDVMLIAMLYVQKTKFKHRIFVKRIKSAPIDETVDEKNEKVAKRKRAAGGSVGGSEKTLRARLEYETLCINTLLLMLHNAAYEAIGRELVIEHAHLTNILVVIMLLNGSDYSRGLPRVGAKSVWEMLEVIVPAFVATTSMVGDAIVLDSELCIDAVFAEIYKAKFSRHVSTTESSFSEVRAELVNSKLSYAVRDNIPTYAALECTIKNVEWVLKYWHLTNENPPVCPDGTHGFSVADGKVRFADTVEMGGGGCSSARV